jgi:hypothetical protein
MSLRDLNETTRRRLHVHAWLLSLWCVAVGLVTSWILLHGFELRSPPARYGIVAILMYSLGLVVGARIWLVRFSRSVAEEPGVLGIAAPHERHAFDAEAKAREQQKELGRTALNWADFFSGLADLLSLEEVAALLIVPALIAALVGVLLLSVGMPVMLMDGLAAMLAEVAVQFVFGALIAKRAMRPKAHDAAFMTIVGRTWTAGLIFFVASAAAGLLLSLLNPGGATVVDLLR